MVTNVKSTAANASVIGFQGFRSKSKCQAIMLFFQLADRVGACFSTAVSTRRRIAAEAAPVAQDVALFCKWLRNSENSSDLNQVFPFGWIRYLEGR